MKAFTFPELLIVITIIILVAIMVQWNLQSFGNQSDLTSTVQSIVSVLRKAQNLSVASKNLSPHGVHFQSNTYILFQGPVYNASSTDNELYTIPSHVEFSSITIAQGNDVLFERIDGRTNNYGTIQLRVIANPAASSTILIEPSGNISTNKFSQTTNTRLTDSRHVHFDLGWSLQGAVTLDLIFKDPPNPDIVNTIPMNPYFNAGQTSFDWEGTTTVSGEDQILHIYTHTLSSTSTVLSIMRDGQTNTKALDVNIDGNAIVSYSNIGVPTVGLFGGTMQIQ